MKKKEKLLLGAIYKSPNSDAANHKRLNELLHKAVNQDYEYTVIAGDFNFPEVDWEQWTVNTNENHSSFHFVECLRDNFLFQHVKENTRFREGQNPSCLDLIITDVEEVIDNIQFGDKLGASDHISIFFNLKCTTDNVKESGPRPNFFKGNYKAIRDYLDNVKWETIDNMEVNDAWLYFMEKVNYCIDNFVPSRSVNNTKFQKPKWMDHYCVRKVKKKYHAWMRFTYTHNYIDYQEYCRARNSATKAVRFSKIKFQKGVADSVKRSPKSFWSYVKDQTKSNSKIGDLQDSNGNIHTDDSDKADILNDFFATVFTRESDSDIPPVDRKVDDNTFIDSVEINPTQILKLLKNLNVSKSCGPDNCHPFFLKECADSLVTPLCNIFTKSIQTGCIPEDWKKANVSCIFKKGDKSDPGNYRPISLTSVICKILEKVIRESIIKYMTTHNLLCDSQFGFRRNRSTILQLLTVLEDWTEYLDNDGQIDTIYLDFKKAFDSVPHKRLVEKLNSYGIQGNLKTWLSNFLTNRQQRVVVNGEASDWQEVLSGIPQGSILGPILFIIFINDLPSVVGNVCKLFADDCKLYKIIKSKLDQDDLQNDIDNLCKWSQDWLLSFNIKKCKVVTFGDKKHDYDYTMNDENGIDHTIKSDKSEKDLGILFTSNLNFDAHINNTVNRVNRLIGLIRRKFTYMDKNIFLTLYKSLIRSNLDYGNLIYYPHTKKNKQILENAQRRATRLLPELRELPYELRLRELHLPTLEYRRKRFDLIQTFKIIRQIDNIDSSVFFKFSSTDLRGHEYKLEKPRAKKSSRLHSFSHRVVSAWNSLPSSIVTASSVEVFKNRLDQHWRDLRYDTTAIY